MVNQIQPALKPAKKGFLYEIKKHKILYLMFLPVAIYFIVFAYFPMSGIILAFKEFHYTDGMFGSPWTGFKNFEFFFKSGKAWTVTRNTVVYNIVFMTLYTVVSITLAVFISEIRNKWFKKISQSMMFLPFFISWVVVSAFAYNILNPEFGLVNSIIKAMGGDTINVYNTPGYWYFILPALYVWKTMGYGSIFYLAAIMSIDRECYESAEIDGASIFDRIFHITIPLLKPTVVTLVLLGVSQIMRGQFDMFYQLIGDNGILLEATDIIDTLVFRSLVGISDFGMAASTGMYQSVMCLIIILTVNYIVRKIDSDYALF